MLKRNLLTAIAVALLVLSGGWTVTAMAQDEKKKDQPQAQQEPKEKDDQGDQQTGEDGEKEEAQEVTINPNIALKSAKLLERRMDAEKDKRIPTAIRQEAKCIVVFPTVIKAGLIVAVKGGQGIGSCRQEKGEWGAPAYFNIAAASIGYQAGLQSASVILIVRDQKGIDELMNGKVSFGSGISIAAGPIGKTAELNTQASVLSYGNTKGLFAGIDFESASLSLAEDENKLAYGDIPAQEIMFSKRDVPEGAKIFHDMLTRFAPQS